MMRSPPVLQPGPGQHAEQEKSGAAGERGEIDQQQRRAAVGIADQVVAPRQARDDDDRKRDQADGAVDENGIGRRAPSGAAARDQPEPHRVAADRGWQRLVEEGADQIVAHRLPGRQRRAAFRADDAPSQHADEDLKEGHGDRKADPAQARNDRCARRGRKNWPCGARDKAALRRPVFLSLKAGSGAFRPRSPGLEDVKRQRNSTPRAELRRLGMVLKPIWQ